MKTITTLAAAGALLAAFSGNGRAEAVLDAGKLCRAVQGSFPGSKVTISGPDKMRVACPGDRGAVKVSIRMGSLEEMQKAAAGGWKPGSDN